MRYFNIIFIASVLVGPASADIGINELMTLSANNVKKWEAENGGKEILPGVGAFSFSEDTNPRTFSTSQNKDSVDSARESDEITYYFISLSMPKKMIYDVYQNLSKNEVVVFRGPLKNESLVDLYDRLTKILLGGNKNKSQDDVAQQLSMQIDPPRFRQCGVKSVPATCVVTQKGVLTAHGILSGEYVKKQGNGEGQSVGKTWPVIEIDLEEEIKRRVMKITPEDLRRETINGLFVNRQYVKLPVAVKDNAFTFDPTVIRVEPFVVAGKEIAQAGQKYNPIPDGFDFSYVVLDATDSRQVNAALRVVKTLLAQKKSVRVMVTDFSDYEKGFQVINELSNMFGTSVKIIDQLLVDSFRLKALPSVIESTKQGMVIVNEVKP
jgi:hypothetical protein